MTSAICSIGVDVGYNSDRTAVAVLVCKLADGDIRQVHSDLTWMNTLEPGTTTKDTLNYIKAVTNVSVTELNYLGLKEAPIVVSVDGVGVGAHFAESLRDELAERIGKHQVLVGSVLASGGRNARDLDPGEGLDFRRSVPAKQLTDNIQVALEQQRADGGPLLKWSTATDGAHRLASDLMGLKLNEAGTRLVSPRGAGGHGDSASALALALSTACAFAKPHFHAARPSDAMHSAIQRIARRNAA